MNTPTVSVIIPTYNRKHVVLRALESLQTQSLPHRQYEVIVVDDGSADDTPTLAQAQFSYAFHYLRQQNQGATKARNNGVRHSRGEILVFMDDDVTVTETTLAALAAALDTTEKRVAMGTLLPRTVHTSLYASVTGAEAHAPATDERGYVHFSFCNTELLAVRRADFFALNMLQDPTDGRGWPNWDDVDFGYRAHLAGFKLFQVTDAIGEHWDYSLGDWRTACQRWQRASKSAVLLFQVHPGLQRHIPMMQDKTPINLAQDPPQLIVRKWLRSVMASTPVMGALERSIDWFEQQKPSPRMLRSLYRWAAGGYMYRGFQQGLHEYTAVSPTGCG